MNERERHRELAEPSSETVISFAGRLGRAVALTTSIAAVVAVLALAVVGLLI